MSGIKVGKEILKQISVKRKKLIEIAERTGLNSGETISCSKELDEMINSFYRWLKDNAENLR